MAITNPTADRQLVEAVNEVDRAQQTLAVMAARHPDPTMRERCSRMEVALRAVSKMGEVDPSGTAHHSYIKSNLSIAANWLGLEVVERQPNPISR